MYSILNHYMAHSVILEHCVKNDDACHYQCFLEHLIRYLFVPFKNYVLVTVEIATGFKTLNEGKLWLF